MTLRVIMCQPHVYGEHSYFTFRPLVAFAQHRSAMRVRFAAFTTRNSPQIRWHSTLGAFCREWIRYYMSNIYVVRSVERHHVVNTQIEMIFTPRNLLKYKYKIATIGVRRCEINSSLCEGLNRAWVMEISQMHLKKCRPTFWRIHDGLIVQIYCTAL